jgi:hypothetical protein
LSWLFLTATGVLVDSEPIINRAHAHVLTACGYPITEGDLVGGFCGMSDAEMLAIIEHEWCCPLTANVSERPSKTDFVNH